MLKYRMYVDEVGHADLTASQKPEQRYLSLTGIVFEVGYADQVVHPLVERWKRTYFDNDSGDQIILHRREIIGKKPPFDHLKDPTVDAHFKAELIEALRTLDYSVFTVVMDKLAFKERYTRWRHNPYHYCLAVIVERFVRWLDRHNSVGDVMAEARGGRDDRDLKAAFTELYEHGTPYVSGEMITTRLTSKQLKLRQKTANVAGLQIADLLAYSSFRAVKCHRENQALPEDINGQIGKILEAIKYDRSPRGDLEGWGRKWLP